MEWKKYPEIKPESDHLCYVTNKKAGLTGYLALYDAYYDFFRMYDPKMYNHPALEVTHFVCLPDLGSVK